VSIPIRWRLTVLTPTLIGDGKRLAPIDYMVWKDQINVLDQSLIFRRLAGTPRMDGYLAELSRAKRLEFKSWGGYAQSYAVRRIPLEDPDLVAQWEAAREEDIFIPTTAIKGALKTALLGARVSVDQMASARHQAADKLLRGLRLGDGSPAPDEHYKVYYSRIAAPVKVGGADLRWKAAPTFVECAAPGTVFSGRGSLEEDLTNDLAAVNSHSRHTLERQRQFATTHRIGKLTQTLNAVAANDGCLLSIGWGGGFVSKSIATGPRLVAARTLLETVPGYRQALATAFAFPKSQRILNLSGEPGTVPGWVRFDYDRLG
jgi:CRISPR-associated protein Csm5